MVRPRKGSGRAGWEHPADVVALLRGLPEGDAAAPGAVNVAWLHDILEDGRIGDLGLAVGVDDLKTNGIDLEVIKDVVALTWKPEVETKADYLRRLRYVGTPRARLVKLADRLANLREGRDTMPAEWMERYAKEALRLVVPLADPDDPAMAEFALAIVKECAEVLA